MLGFDGIHTELRGSVRASFRGQLLDGEAGGESRGLERLLLLLPLALADLQRFERATVERGIVSGPTTAAERLTGGQDVVRNGRRARRTTDARPRRACLRSGPAANQLE